MALYRILSSFLRSDRSFEIPTNLLDMAKICRAASAEYIEVVSTGLQPGDLGAEQFRVTVVKRLFLR